MDDGGRQSRKDFSNTHECWVRRVGSEFKVVVTADHRFVEEEGDYVHGGDSYFEKVVPFSVWKGRERNVQSRTEKNILTAKGCLFTLGILKGGRIDIPFFPRDHWVF